LGALGRRRGINGPEKLKKLGNGQKRVVASTGTRLPLVYFCWESIKTGEGSSGVEKKKKKKKNPPPKKSNRKASSSAKRTVGGEERA